MTSFNVLKNIPFCVLLHFCFFWSYPHGRVTHWWLHTFIEAPKHRLRSGRPWNKKWPQCAIVQRGHHCDRRWRGMPGWCPHIKDGRGRAVWTTHTNWHKQMGYFSFLEVNSFCTFFIWKLNASQTKPTAVFKWRCIMELYSECLKWKSLCRVQQFENLHEILQARILEWVAFPFSGILPTQGWSPGLLHCRQILYQLSHSVAAKNHVMYFVLV